MTTIHNLALVAGALAVLATSSGCATTSIYASEPGAQILVDGAPVGRGMASVNQTGFPGSVQVTAKTDDGRTVNQTMSRSFGWTAGLLGFITYGVCFIACWQYPSALYLALPPPAADPFGSGFANPGAPGAPRTAVDPWLSPP